MRFAIPLWSLALAWFQPSDVVNTENLPLGCRSTALGENVFQFLQDFLLYRVVGSSDKRRSITLIKSNRKTCSRDCQKRDDDVVRHSMLPVAGNHIHKKDSRPNTPPYPVVLVFQTAKPQFLVRVIVVVTNLPYAVTGGRPSCRGSRGPLVLWRAVEVVPK